MWTLYFPVVVSCFFLSSFFLAYSQQLEIGCLPYFHAWCGLSVNLECRSEMCCTRLAGNTGCKNYAKNRHLCTCTTLSGYIFETKACIDSCKKLVKQQYLLQTSPQYGELQPTNGSDRLASLGTQANFNGFCVLASLLQQRHSLEANHTAWCLAVSWAGTLYIYIFGAVVPWRSFATCKVHFASKSCVLLYSQRYCTALQQRASAKLRRGTTNGIT